MKQHSSANRPQPKQWRYQDEARAQSLWLECLLYGQLSLRPEYPDIFLPTYAETAYAAAWAALDEWEIEESHKCNLHRHLSSTATFLQTLKPNRNRPGIFEIRARLQKIRGQGANRTEVWAYVIGHWLQEHRTLESSLGYENLLELGWPLASFGATFWTQDPVQYRKDQQLLPLVQPFQKADAFSLFGPFSAIDSPRPAPTGERLVFGSLEETRGLKEPRLWRLEAKLAAVPGVRLTTVGHVHRQFAGDLPEWFEAIEITYDPRGADLESLLHHFWEHFSSSGDLLFYTNDAQEHRCRQAWETFKAKLPDWAVPNQLHLKPCNWFEAAASKRQKSHLRGLPLLEQTFSHLDLARSHLATKVNAFAGGCGTDEEVVLLAARYGLDDGLTLALRTIRHFANTLNQV